MFRAGLSFWRMQNKPLLVRCLVMSLMSGVGSILAGDLTFLKDKRTRCGFGSYRV
jgi:hypothetical protein